MIHTLRGTHRLSESSSAALKKMPRFQMLMLLLFSPLLPVDGGGVWP